MTAKPLTCAFGTPWTFPHVCQGCQAESDRLAAQFEAEVQAGKFDRWGYSPREASTRPPMQLPLEMA